MPELTSIAGAAIGALKERTRRDSAAGTSNLTYTGCGHWSQWISRNTPMSPFSREEEHFTPDDLQKLCPSGMVKDFRCKDEKGEAIHDIINETSVDKTFVFYCYNMSSTCYVLNSTGAICPDYAIKIRCECSSTTTTTPTQSSLPWSGSGNGTSVSEMGRVTIGIGPGSGRETSNSGSDVRKGTSGLETGSGTGGSEAVSETSRSGPGSGTGGNLSGRYDSFAGASFADGNFSAGGTSTPWLLIPLVVSLVLFVVNLILVLCVYNKLKMQIRTNQVRPI
ncbi:hypothetical protein DPMN_089308 [Dreissena polymorpha]|uniref:Uncharacterized protein n=2 Tax=Dreissena polymorpha TaxID=45954 RepID=A0A9D4KVQ4_DREPO|nr:hypothetical protein DPMN_089308 [Dreissena polymorpha]